MQTLTYKELELYLNEILKCNAFELHSDKSQHSGFDHPTSNYYIPYMMNDALECYLLLKNAHMTGEYLSDLKVGITIKILPQANPAQQTHSSTKNIASVETISPENSSAIIFRQGTENVFTIWFEEAFCVLKCFRYDQIGHFWVKGTEHWRRLVYIIGTIYDKYEYMGNQVCNEKEMALLPLMEFAPFRMYSPIHESLDSFYSDTLDGIACMCRLAAESEDKAFLRLLKIYQLLPFSFMRNILFRALNHPHRQNLYELIYKKVEEASSCYPERSYHPALNAEIAAARNEVSTHLRQKGFAGSYPLFYKKDCQVLAMEEHPFTILEAKDFSFRIQFMISEVSGTNADIDTDISRLNAGFFKKRGNRSRIASDLNDI